MHLSPRQLIVACSLAFACLLITRPLCGQIDTGQSFSPNRSVVVTTDRPSEIIDHSSMSPDSWSAPPVTITNVAPVVAHNAKLSRTAAIPWGKPFQVPGDSLGVSQRHPLATAGQAKKSVLSGPTSSGSSSPSIPDLKAASTNRSPQQGNSLIRQPSDAVKFPFRQVKHRQSGTTSLPSSGQTTIANPFFSGTSTPPYSSKAPGMATGELGLTPTVSVPTAADRYPLGINNGFIPTTTEAPAFPETVLIQQPVIQQPVDGLPAFRPDLGHRTPNPTFRGRDHDSGLKLDFEDKKKEYPGLGEILATGRYFGSVSALYLQPAFQQNSVITQFNSSAAAATFASSESFDFDYEAAPRLRLGFESRFGPGVEIDYWQYDQGSNVSEFTSNGSNSGQLSSGLFGPSSLTTLEAVNAGDRLSAIHSIDVETFSVTFFKEIKFPISRLNGMFGFQYASVFQELDAELTDAGGDVIGAIRSTSDLRAYGPKVRFEYYRPIGHTKLEFITAFGGSVLFGERDQIVTNNQTPAVNRFSADEYVLTSDFYGGVQWKKQTAEKRGYYARIGITHQSWVGGGSAVSSEANFGLRGFAFEVGLNR